MKKMMIAVLVAAFAAVQSFAAALPEAVGGVVTLVAGETYTLTEASSLAGITKIAVTEGATLVYDVSEGATLTIPCPVNGKGKVIKNGKGTAHYTYVNSSTQDLKSYYIEYPGWTTVNAGRLKYPSYQGLSSYTYSGVLFGRMVVNQPGVVDVEIYSMAQFEGLWGDGEVTAAAGTVNQLIIVADKGKAGETYSAPSKFYGKLTGTVRFRPAGYADIISTDSTCNGDTVFANGCDIGIMKFGGAGAAGSFGTKAISLGGQTVKIRYLGEGESVGKNIFYAANSAELTLDGGANGALAIAGGVSVKADLGKNTSLTLDGDHATECVVNSDIKEANGFKMNLTKRGSGTWALEGVKTLSGAVKVEAGDLRLLGAKTVPGYEGNFTWFKLVIRGVYGSGEANHQLEELAFYDENGKRIKDGFELVRTYEEFVGDYTHKPSFPDLSNIQPGQYGWLTNGNTDYYQPYGNRDANRLFDGCKSNPVNCIAMGGTSPKPTTANSEHTLLIRMPTGAPKVAAFDLLAADDANGVRAITDWTMMGSEDGKTWYTLKTYNDPGLENRPAKHCWFSNNSATKLVWYNAAKLTEDDLSDARRGFDATRSEGAVVKATNPIANAASVEVAGGSLVLDGSLSMQAIRLSGGTLAVAAGEEASKVAALAVSGESAITLAEGTKLVVPTISELAGVLRISCASLDQIDLPELTLAQKTMIYVNGEPLIGRDGKRVAFLGDSITHGGHWEYILNYFDAMRNPGQGNRYLNCGISGDTAPGGLARLESDVFSRDVDEVVVMFGMNDIGRGNYVENPTQAQLDNREVRFASYESAMRNIVGAVQAKGKPITVVTPTPFDEYGVYEGAQENAPGCNEIGLATVAARARTIAAEKGTGLIELHQPMTAIYKSLENETSKAKRFNRVDRVHPEFVGHVLMSIIYWSQLHGDAPYSERTFEASGSSFSIVYTPDGLPLPKSAEVTRAMEVAPEAVAAINREIVRISGLDDGEYLLLAEGANLGKYTAAALAAGVNIAGFDTPSQIASQKAFATMKAIEAKDVTMRGIVMMEIQAQKLRPGIDLSDYETVKSVLTTWVAGVTSNKEYYQNMVNSYIANKPKQAALEAEVDALVSQMQGECLPASYTLSAMKQGSVVIQPNQGEVRLSPAQLAAAVTIEIGAGSTLVIDDPSATVTLSADISGKGALSLGGGAYVEICGDNRGFEGAKEIKDAFVTVSSRYGLGSPAVTAKVSISAIDKGYLRFAGEGLVNDVPLSIAGRGFAVSTPYTALTADRNDKLVLNGALTIPEAAGFRIGNGWEIAGGYTGANSPWNTAYAGCEYWVTGPFTVSNSGNYYVLETATLHLAPNAASTKWPTYLYPRGGATIVCEGENVWGTGNWLALGAHASGTAGSPTSAATFDLNGYDQTFSKLAFYGEHSVDKSWTGLKLYVTSSKPATLTVTDGSKSREGIRFTGEASLNFVGGGAWTNALFYSETKGTLTVGDGVKKGEVFFDWGAGWGGDIVLNGGKFGCDSADGVNKDGATRVTITNGGKLIVPAGVTLALADVTVDGKALKGGTYSGESWLEGAGSVKVTPTRKGLRIMMK